MKKGHRLHSAWQHPSIFYSVVSLITSAVHFAFSLPLFRSVLYRSLFLDEHFGFLHYTTRPTPIHDTHTQASLKQTIHLLWELCVNVHRLFFFSGSRHPKILSNASIQNKGQSASFKVRLGVARLLSPDWSWTWFSILGRYCQNLLVTFIRLVILSAVRISLDAWSTALAPPTGIWSLKKSLFSSL